MEGVGDTHGIRSRRREDFVDWLIRVLYKLEYYGHPLLSYCGVIALLEGHGCLGVGWDYEVWTGACGPKQSIGGM